MLRVRVAVALSLVLGAALVVPTAAAAKPRWIEGKLEWTMTLSCASLVAGPIQTEGVRAQVGFRADRKRLPRRGQPFYARVFVGGVGEPCVTQLARIEVVLPTGVKPAVSAKRPIRCSWFPSTDSPIRKLSAAEGCPRKAFKPSRLGYGSRPSFMFPRTTRQDGLWELPRGYGYFIDFPVRSKRTLKGIARGLPSCQRTEDEPPCPPAKARDHLQAGIFVIDGVTDPWVVPQVGLFVRR